MPVRSRYSRRRRWRRNRRRRRGRRPATGRYRWRRKNGIFNARLSETFKLTIPAQTSVGSWYTDRMSWKLKDFLPGLKSTENPKAMPFQYYRIRKIKVTFYPHQILSTQQVCWGTTAIDLDGTATAKVATATHNPYENRSSAHGWLSTRIHHRYFTPKPQVDTVSGETEWFQPNNKRNQLWLNVNADNVPHYGLVYAMYNSPITKEFQVHITAYVQFREFSLVDYPPS